MPYSCGLVFSKTFKPPIALIINSNPLIWVLNTSGVPTSIWLIDQFHFLSSKAYVIGIRWFTSRPASNITPAIPLKLPSDPQRLKCWLTERRARPRCKISSGESSCPRRIARSFAAIARTTWKGAGSDRAMWKAVALICKLGRVSCLKAGIVSPQRTLLDHED